MALCGLLRDLIRDKGIGPRIVRSSLTRPGHSGWTRSSHRQDLQPARPAYTPSIGPDPGLQGVSSGTDPAHRINEAGSVAAFTAAGTAYATHGEPTDPVYVFYSMFGFQRTGDAMWAAMDQMTRGFIIGATAAAPP